MAHVWIPVADAAGPAWAALPLAGQQYHFVSTEPYVRRAEVTAGPAAGEMLVRSEHAGTECWYVLASWAARLWVNGRQAPLGVKVLADRDEIRLENGCRCYFSTERAAKVVPFPGTDHETVCPRCGQPIEKGTPAVLCPECATWHHQASPLTCWWYEASMQCQNCEHSTEPDAGFQWTPESL